MAFLLSVSSSIGKRILLFGLRQIDLLDKDPSDFVTVDVGKRTTLEVRDVGLRVKKLVSLLQLKLPPEFRLSKARASLLRVSFLLDFGVPTIIIELEGVQVYAKVSEDEGSVADRKSSGRPPAQGRKPSALDDSASDLSTDGREQIPTVEDLTKSFLREEPAEEVRELEEALNTQSEYLQESTISSEDGDEESSTGMGAGLGLPAVLRNLLNTALDRLQITVNGIDVQVDGTLPAEPANSSTDDDPSVSLNFHIAKVSIDSLPSAIPQVDLAPVETSTAASNGRDGKRRMRIESVCARLISKAENFASLAKISRPPSPVDVRSNASSRRKSASESSFSAKPPDHQEISSQSTSSLVDQPEMEEDRSLPSSSSSEMPFGPDRLESSLLTVDDDRFADAASDEESDEPAIPSPTEVGNSTIGHPQQFPLADPLAQSTEFDDDDGIIDYAVDNGLFASRHSEAANSRPSSPGRSFSWGAERDSSSQFSRSPVAHIAATAPTLTAPMDQSMTSQRPSVAVSEPRPSSGAHVSTDNLDSAMHVERHLSRHSSGSSSASSRMEDLAQSKLFTHDEAESMYMSAMSATPLRESRDAVVPGGWDSMSNSSQDTDPVPHHPQVLAPVVGTNRVNDVDDGCETPRPGSRASTISTPANDTQPLPVVTGAPKAPGSEGTTDTDTADKISKPFLTIDGINVWFPLHLSEQQATAEADVDSAIDESSHQFPPAADLGEDSIFQGMPGSFSFYAEATAKRRKSSSEPVSTRKEGPVPISSKADAAPHARRINDDTGIEIDIGSVCGHVDLSTGRMIFQLLQKVFGILGRSPEPGRRTKKQELRPVAASEISFNLTVQRLSLVWLERLMTESVTGDEQSRTFFNLEENPTHAILRAGFSGVHVLARSRSEEASLRLRVRKFVLGSMGHDVISFNSRHKSSSTKAGTGDQLEHDVAVDMQQGSDCRIAIDTRPIKVLFDLQRLDDALGSFGGFSGVLELGNSITSNASHQSSPSPPAYQRPKGVHFDRMPPPAIPPPPSTPGSSLKVNIRFGDVFLVLRGRSCAVHLQTSPVKLVVRENNFRMQISDIQLSGPYLKTPCDQSPLSVRLKDTRVSFLFTPEEVDLAKLISIITPSKDPYEDDSDILMDTLLRQRQKGSVIRAEVDDVYVQMDNIEGLRPFEELGAEMARLSKVTKYLPEDDRPGILSLVSVQKLEMDVTVSDRIGCISLSCQNSLMAHVGLPSLLGLEVGKVLLNRKTETLIHEVTALQPKDQFPMIMARMIGDELEPRIKVKLFNLCFEYYVSTVTALLGLPEEGTADNVLVGIASSVATITGPTSPETLSRQASSVSASPSNFKALQLDLLLRKCALGLNPSKLESKGLFVLSDARFSGSMPKRGNVSAMLELRKASVHAIDNIGRIGSYTGASIATPSRAFGDPQLQKLVQEGFVSLGNISGAKADVQITGADQDQPQIVNVEFTNDFLVLETCADSTQTLIAILNGLKPPLPPSAAQQYRTVVPLQEMMASFSGDAFAPEPEGADEGYIMDDADRVADEVPNNMEFVGSFYNPESIPTEEDIGDSMLGEDDLQYLASPPVTRIRGERGLLESFQEQYEVVAGEKLEFDDNYFGSDPDVKGTARKWDSTRNQYHLSNEFKAPGSPFKVRIRDMNITWHLFDGYDWPRTREIIGQAVEDVEKRAEERRQKMAAHWDDEDDNVAVEEDFLFQSVWISIPVNEEKGALARKINQEVVGDNYSETGSYATTTNTSSTVRPHSAQKSRRRRLRLERSKKRKIAFELQSVAVDLVVFPPGQDETQSSVNVRVNDFTIYDHVPTSTWRKFVTSLQAPNERELGRPMINLELLTVKPVQELAASELVVKVTVLPLRLHVDQDALDFITRFFEFKDDTAPEPTEQSEQPFIQRLEVNTVKLKLDYKPKKVDYAGLRSGHTTEFMNFFILDSADITLRHAILYGITSFDRLHKTLNDVWMPDVKRNQLPGVLAGLAPVRNIVNVGKGVTDLVYVPVKEYKKDGRIVRSLQKGVFAFAKNTSSELARLGAKVAIGAQNVLEGAEGFLSPTSAAQHPSADSGWEDIDPTVTDDPEEQRAVSNYANQPLGVMAGLRGAARHLERDLLTARDAVIAIPTEVMESGSAAGAAKAVIRRAPTVVFRPALGATKAVSNTLFGVSNAIDKQNRRKIEDKYKNY